MRLWAASLLALSASLAACTEDSSELKTEEIFPTFVVRTDAAGNSRFSAHLVSDFITTVDLVGGDQIIVRSGSNSAILGADTTMLTGNAENTPIRFDFERPREADAPNSIGKLPAPFTLTAPAADTQYIAQIDGIIAMWSGLSGIDPMSAEIEASCRTFTGSKPEDQSYVTQITGDLGIARIDLRSFADQLSRNCSLYDATLTLRRTRNGTIDEAFGPTEECRRSSNCSYPTTAFYLRQVRSVAIVIANMPPPS